MRVLLLIFFIFLYCFPTDLRGQSKALETERKTILRRIKKTQNILKRTRRDKYSLIKQVRTIRERVRQQERLLAVLQEEIAALGSDIEESEQIVEALERDLTALKAEYGQMVYTEFKFHNEYEKLAYLFASESIQQMLARLQYIQKYKQMRSEQIERINGVKESLEARKLALQASTMEKRQLIGSLREERESLIQLRRRQQNLAKEMKEKESEVLRELKNEQRVLNEVENLISQQIQSAEFSSALSEGDKLLSSAFAKNKGRLIWPTRDGFISARFGLHTYMTSGEGKHKKDIKVQKLGVDIQTNPNEPVRAVFTGTVVDVTQIPGRGYMVMLQHGDYFTVYAKLKSVEVEIGQEVKVREQIGVVLTNAEKVAEVEFQVWRHLEKLDPEVWLTQ